MLALAVECAALFLVLPVVVARVHRKVNPIILLIAVSTIALAILLRDSSFNRRELWQFDRFEHELTLIFTLWILSTLAMITLVRVMHRESLFRFPRENQRLWAKVMLFYPILSVIPQTIIFRVFFMHRYEPIFGNGWEMIYIAAFAFGWAHLIFRHPLPIILTTVIGILFSWRFAMTHSAPISAMEHALYGNMVFTVGLGKYFYHGSQRLVARVVKESAE